MVPMIACVMCLKLKGELETSLDLHKGVPVLQDVQYRGSYKNAGAGFNDIRQVALSLKKFGVYCDDPAKVRHNQHGK